MHFGHSPQTSDPAKLAGKKMVRYSQRPLSDPFGQAAIKDFLAGTGKPVRLLQYYGDEIVVVRKNGFHRFTFRFQVLRWFQRFFSAFMRQRNGQG